MESENDAIEDVSVLTAFFLLIGTNIGDEGSKSSDDSLTADSHLTNIINVHATVFSSQQGCFWQQKIATTIFVAPEGFDRV